MTAQVPHPDDHRRGKQGMPGAHRCTAAQTRGCSGGRGRPLHLAWATSAYNRYRYDPEKRKALDTWAAHLQNLVDGREPTTNVVPFVRYA